MRKLILGTAVALSLTTAATAQANSNTTTFDGFALGSVHNQAGWKAIGPSYDAKVFEFAGDETFRVSNAVTGNSFGDMPFSAPVESAGETTGRNTLVSKFKFRSATGDHQSGLSMSISQTDGEGARMSYVRLDDTTDGVKVTFVDTPSGNVNPMHHVSFDSQEIATLNRTDWHTLRFETTFVPGQDNDIVRVSVDDKHKVCGESWENYYRYDIEQQGGGNEVDPSDRLIWRLGGAPVSTNMGNGFLFDDVTNNSYDDAYPVACSLPVGPVGPQGDKGDTGSTGANGANGADGQPGTAGAKGDAGANGIDGKNGVNGKDGVTTIIREQIAGEPAKLFGNTVRTLTVSKLKGAKLVSAKATLRGKKLPVSGRKVKIDLTGKAAGSYRVSIVAKYKKGGKLRVVHSTRSLSISSK